MMILAYDEQRIETAGSIDVSPTQSILLLTAGVDDQAYRVHNLGRLRLGHLIRVTRQRSGVGLGRLRHPIDELRCVRRHLKRNREKRKRME